LRTIDGRELRTALERHIIPYRITGKAPAITIHRTISRKDAQSLIMSPQLIEALPKIRLVNNARFPIRRADGHIELLPEGYDPESRIFTQAGGEVEMPASKDDILGLSRALGWQTRCPRCHRPASPLKGGGYARSRGVDRQETAA
jgi:hypothetical protein